MQISIVNLRDGRTTKIDTPDNITIKDLKNMFFIKEGTHPSKQVLFYEGQLLADYRTLAHYQFQSETALMLAVDEECIDIFIRTPDGENTTLHVKSADTIASLKAKIEVEMDYDFQETQLSFQDSFLENHRKLSDYAIEDHSLLKLTVRYN